MLLTNIPEFIFFKEVASLVALKLWPHCHSFSIGLRSRLEPFYAKRDKTKWLHPRMPLNRAFTKDMWSVDAKMVTSPRWALHLVM